MVVLGIVLIVLAVLLGLGISVSSSDSTTMSVFGVDFGMVVPTLFFIGAAAGAAVVIGLWLTKKGLSRGYRRRKEVKELRQQAAAAPATATEPEPATTGRTSEEAYAADEPDSRTVDINSGEPRTGDPAPERRTGDPVATPEGRIGEPVAAPERRTDSGLAPESRTGDTAAAERRTGEPTAAERLAAERHNVADGTDSKQPH